MENSRRSWVTVAVVVLALIAMTATQKSGTSPKGSSGSKLNQIQSSEKSSSKNHLSPSLPGIPNYQNGNLSFVDRFGKPPRVSESFHYPALATDYWLQHKRPVVPIWDEELFQ